jgi:hypothetical protein
VTAQRHRSEVRDSEIYIRTKERRLKKKRKKENRRRRGSRVRERERDTERAKANAQKQKVKKPSARVCMREEEKIKQRLRCGRSGNIYTELRFI